MQASSAPRAPEGGRMAAESSAEGTQRAEAWVADWQALMGETPAGWAAPRRQAAIERFRSLGFPTTRLETWKYTNITPVVRAAVPAARRAGGFDFEGAWLDGVSGARVALADGHFVAAASSLTGLPDKVRLLPLGAALAEHRDLVEPLLGALTPADDAMAALNEAYLGDGVVLVVPAGATVEEPIQIVHASSGGASHPRTLIALGRGAAARVVETWLDAGAGSRFVNSVAEVSLADGAVLDLASVGLQGPDSHGFHALFARVGRSATLRSGTYALGAAIARHEVSVALAEEGAACELSGLALVSGRRHADLRTFVDHAAPHGTSHQVFKGVASDAGRTVFNGRVLVRPGAQKTDARQSSQNLLLGEQAWADARPQLEIFADDVKCSHGATVGQLDADALFYLQARGIGAEEARAILTGAFAAEVVDRAPVVAVRPALMAALGGGLATGAEEVA